MEATEPQCTTEIIDTVVAIFQVAFWIGAFALALLTYQQAKKTIFAGSRNEVFKLQMEELKQLLSFLGERDNFDYDAGDKPRRLYLINVFSFILNNFNNINIDDKKKLEEHIEINKKENEKYGFVQPGGELIVFTNDESRIVLNKTYAVLLSRFDSRSALDKYKNSIFVPQVVKDEIQEFLDYEDEKQNFISSYLEGKTFVHDEIDSNSFEYALEIYHESYKLYSEKYKPAVDIVGEIQNKIKEYLKIDDLIG